MTGGIGSGKSSVCRLLEQHGARVFYADAEAKALMHDDSSARTEIIAAFGEASYRADGTLDRAYLAQQVFGDAAKVAQINAIVHPRVRQRLLAATAQAQADGVALMAYEAALIFETSGDQVVDAVIVVDAPVAERIARVVARDGSTREQVEARMAHQMNSDEMRARADFVLENSGDMTDLSARVQALVPQLLDLPPRT